MKKIVALILIICFVGCEVEETYNARALPSPTPEAPVVNIPRSLRIHNWLGDRREGSCVHATTKNTLIWLGDIEGALHWNYSNGETATGLEQKLAKAGYSYVSTRSTREAETWRLDWASDMRLPAIIWWKPSHCCMFAGYSRGSDILEAEPDLRGQIDPSKEYAAVLDNTIRTGTSTQKVSIHTHVIGYGGYAAIILVVQLRQFRIRATKKSNKR